MKYLNRFGRLLESKEEENEIREVCIWLQDLVDDIEITTYSLPRTWPALGNERCYNINISYRRQGSSSIDDILKNAEKLHEITKEYTDLLLRLEDLGYKVSYHLLENKHHLDFFTMTGIIQIQKQ